MNFNIALQTEQEQRQQNELAAIEAQINQETDFYHIGRFDGLINCKPTNIEEQSYWSGYQVGQREYWAKKLGVIIPTEF